MRGLGKRSRGIGAALQNASDELRLDWRPRFGVRHCCAAFRSLQATFVFSSLLSAPLPNRLQDFGDGFGARFGAEIALPVNADADGVGFHVAFSDHEHRVEFNLLGALDFAVDLSVLSSISADLAKGPN